MREKFELLIQINTSIEKGEIPNLDDIFHADYLYLKDNKTACIHLAMRKQDTGQDYYIGKKDDVKSGSGAIDHVAFNADDIEGMKSKLDKISMEYTHRKVPGFPLEQLFVMDPDGVKVELNYATS